MGGTAFTFCGIGLILLAVTMHTVWHSPMRLADWHHGFFMLAFGGVAFGYGWGAWKTELLRCERDDALQFAESRDERYRALEGVVARSMNEGKNGDGKHTDGND